MNLIKKEGEADPGCHEETTLLSTVEITFYAILNDGVGKMPEEEEISEGQVVVYCRPNRCCVDHMYTASETI